MIFFFRKCTFEHTLKIFTFGFWGFNGFAEILPWI